MTDSTATTTRSEKVYVLFGSQTGNSEQWAKEICDQIPTKLSPNAIQKLTGTHDEVTVQPVHMQLDDFLELEKCTWTRLMVIVTSSYGVGQAPLGCYRYRDLCDAWCEQYKKKESSDKPSILQGLSFALCGLGDSKYTTFFQNPTRIDEAMHLVGAKRVGPLGKADASGTGEQFQSTVVERWINDIWPHLAKVVAQPPLPDDRLKEMQMSTVQLCQKINPDFVYDEGGSSGNSSMFMYLAALLVALLAAALYYYVKAQQ